MKVYIVILHYGDIALTQQCIESLYQHEKISFSLIIVNNAAQKYSWKNFSSKKLLVINNTRNLGFAKGVNKGIKKALAMKAEYVCLLNNDTNIKQPFLQQLLSVLEDRKIGIAGPAIRFKKNEKTLYDIGGKIHPLTLRTSHKEVTSVPRKQAQYVDYVSGCCMVVKEEVFQKIGLFDEHFFLYFEDVDFCLRAKKGGFATMVVPSAVISHALSASAGKMSKVAIYNLLKSSMYFGEKYARSSVQKILNKLFILVQTLLFFKANPSAGVAIAKALLD